MGRKPKYDVKSLEIGQKLPFPKKMKYYIFQYLNGFHRQDETRRYKKTVKDGKFFIERVE